MAVAEMGQGVRGAAGRGVAAAESGAPFSESEERLIAVGQAQLARVPAEALLAYARRGSQPAGRLGVLRVEAVRRELAARAGTAEEQVLRHVAASAVLSVVKHTAAGFQGYTLQVRNCRYPGTEHSAGLHFATWTGCWMNACGVDIPDPYVLAYLRAYEDDPTRHPMDALQDLTRAAN